jgi:hypothetical protein
MDRNDATNSERTDAEEIRAFLDREASRRTLQRAADADVVASIRSRRSRPGPTRALGAVVAAALIVALGLVGSALVIGPSTSRSSSPSPTNQSPSAAASLGLPVVAVGHPCPVSQPTASGNGSVSLLGDGPVRLVLASAAGTVFFEDVGVGDWKSIDVHWTSALGFSEQVRVRGARLDGSEELRFGDPTDPLTELQIAATGGQTPVIGGRSVISTTPIRIKGAGCFGLRIDSGGASSVVVFEAKPIQDAFAQLERPLQLPAAGLGACPVSPATDSVPFLTVALGEGPLYVGDVGGAFSGADQSGGYAFIKEIWIADPAESGPILVRGGRIDTPGDLRFGDGPEPAAELRFPIHSYEHTGGQPLGWRIFNGYVRPPSPGCYAMQLDTLAGSRWLVFEVTP